MDLVTQARFLIKEGIYDPKDLFNILYFNNRVHYSKVREAINYAKTR